MAHARMMTEVQGLARFVARTSLRNTSADGIRQLTIRVLDTLGAIIAARHAPPVMAVHSVLDDLGGKPCATLMGGGKSSVEHAAFYHGAATACAGLADAYVTADGVTWPSEYLGAVLAAAEQADASGAEFMTALAVAYEVHVQLIDAVGAATQSRFDLHTLAMFAATAGTTRALHLDERQIGNALAIAASANVALRVSHTGQPNDWANLAGAHVAREAVFASVLARQGITGPEAVIEGAGGLRDAITGPFELDWPKRSLEALRRTTLRQYRADPRWQSALEAAADIHAQVDPQPSPISSVQLHACSATCVSAKAHETTGHDGLASALATMLVHGTIPDTPWVATDPPTASTDELARHVTITCDPTLDVDFPQKIPARLEVSLADGRVLHATCEDAAGSPTRPWTWDMAVAKFNRLAAAHVDELLRKEIVSIVHGLEHHKIVRLTEALQKIPSTEK